MRWQASNLLIFFGSKDQEPQNHTKGVWAVRLALLCMCNFGEMFSSSFVSGMTKFKQRHKMFVL